MASSTQRPPARQAAATLEDAELVARCLEGDDHAWVELVERFSRYVYAIVSRGYGLREHDAEDVFQEVFARTYESLDTLRDAGAIRPFIAQLARRLAIDRLRASARTEPTADPELGMVTDPDVFERLDEALTVQEALRELPDRCSEIVDRFFTRDESYRTIGEALDLPSGTIASRISRCLAKLREKLEGRK